MKTTATTTAVAAVLLAFAGCQDAPDAPETAASPEAPAPGDPAHYAPDGWPLRIGDKITECRYMDVRNEFSGYRGLKAVHAVDGDVYSARFREVDGKLERPPCGSAGNFRHWVYEGHFPGMLARPWSRENPAREERMVLPPEFWGKIEYREAYQGPVFRHGRERKQMPKVDVFELLYGEEGGKGREPRK